MILKSVLNSRFYLHPIGPISREKQLISHKSHVWTFDPQTEFLGSSSKYRKSHFIKQSKIYFASPKICKVSSTFKTAVPLLHTLLYFYCRARVCFCESVLLNNVTKTGGFISSCYMTENTTSGIRDRLHGWFVSGPTFVFRLAALYFTPLILVTSGGPGR